MFLHFCDECAGKKDNMSTKNYSAEKRVFNWKFKLPNTKLQNLRLYAIDKTNISLDQQKNKTLYSK